MGGISPTCYYLSMPFRRRLSNTGGGSGPPTGLPVPRVLSTIQSSNTRDLLDLLDGSVEPLRFVSRGPSLDPFGFSVSRSVRYGPAPRKALAGDRRYSVLRQLSFDGRKRECVSRVQRRQVLFARRIAGRRGRSPGPYRRTYFSQFSCR